MNDEERARTNHPSENPKWWGLKVSPFIVERAPAPVWPSHDDIIEALLFAMMIGAIARRPYPHFGLPFLMERDWSTTPYNGPNINPFKFGDVVDWKLTDDPYVLERIAALKAKHGVGPYRVMSATNSEYIGGRIGTVPPQVTVMPMLGVALTTTPFAYSWFTLIEESES